MTEKSWKDMTPKERSAHARSFIGKKKRYSQADYEKEFRIKPLPPLGRGIANLSQDQRDAILRHPAINRPRKFR